jgi:hypothetical protein
MKFDLKHLVPKHLVLCAAILLPFAMTACTNNEMSKADKFAPQQVDFATPDLAESISIGKIDRTFDSSEIMHLNIPVRVASGLMGLTVDYRITYFDENRSPVDVPTAWQSKSLTPGIWEYIQTNSTSPKAKDFQIDFRWSAQ